MWVKICGLTTIEDAQAAAVAGADAVGFVFAESPRQVSIDAARAISHALPPFVTRVGVFVEPTYDEAMRAVEGARLHVVQVHGDVEESTIERLRELGCDVMQAVAMRDEPPPKQHCRRSLMRYCSMRTCQERRVAPGRRLTGGSRPTSSVACNKMAGMSRSCWPADLPPPTWPTPCEQCVRGPSM